MLHSSILLRIWIFDVTKNQRKKIEPFLLICKKDLFSFNEINEFFESSKKDDCKQKY